MRIIVYLLCLIMLGACTGDRHRGALDSSAIEDSITMAEQVDSIQTADSLKIIAARKVFKPYNLVNGFTVIDTGYYGSGTLEGYYAIVKKEGQATDTIHLGMGVKEISKGNYLYLRLCRPNYQEEMAFGTLHLQPGEYIITSNGREVPFTTLVNDFDLYRSNPNVINGKIYFWQYTDKQSNKICKINASEYNPKTKEIRRHYLFTDNPDKVELHIWAPQQKNGNIVFYWHGHSEWTFTPDFKLLK
ncbi:MAG: hypothetical protein EOP51_25955 [Sphingobacteriales bacterium]|nr:MAG: hypothetical protein EOP51_25955 [Sphingobacteriales bacterium]